jgi:RimJ/RimL family protein N-acetyltransferase
MGLPEIVAVTMARNLRSQAVMRRIGMTNDPAEDFDDPDVDEGPLRRHVVYRKLRDPKTDGRRCSRPQMVLPAHS